MSEHPKGSITVTFWEGGAELLVNRNAPQLSYVELSHRLKALAHEYSLLGVDAVSDAPDFDVRLEETHG